MSEKYTDKEKEIIDLLLRRLWMKAVKMGFSYQKIANNVKARSRVTVWRWFRKTNKCYPSQHHIYNIKRFLGYSVN